MSSPLLRHPNELQKRAQWLARREWALVYQLGHLLSALSKDGYWKLGYGHWDAFLQEVLGLSLSTARRWIELALGVDRFPALRESFGAGRLCPSKVDLLLPVLKKHPDEETDRVHQAERLNVRALRRALTVDLEDELDLVYVSYELTARQVLAWRGAREAARIHLQAEVPRGEILEYAVAEFLSGEERLAYEDVLIPARCERVAPEIPPMIHPLELVRPDLPETPEKLQEAALRLLWERHEVELRQGELLLELAGRLKKRAAAGEFARACLGLEKSTAYKRMAVSEGCQRHPQLRRLSCERAWLLLPLLDLGVSHDWIDFATKVSVVELKRWVRHVRFQHSFCFSEFVGWAWRAPNSGERPVEGQRAGLLPTLACRALEGALTIATRTAVQLLNAGDIGQGIEHSLHRPVQVSEEALTRRIGWMVPRDFYPLLAEGIDLASESLFSAPGLALEKIFTLFVDAYGVQNDRSKRGKVRRRDEYRCQAPGCTGRGLVQVHHIQYRSRGGSEEMWNKICVCSACHHLIHLGILGVAGRAPDELVWIRPCERWERGRKVKSPMSRFQAPGADAETGRYG